MIKVPLLILRGGEGTYECPHLNELVITTCNDRKGLVGVREGYVIDSANVSINLFHLKHQETFKAIAINFNHISLSISNLNSPLLAAVTHH
jgi:hypothetical protein